MYEAVASLLTFNASIFFATGNSPRRRGNEHPTIVPYETFEAADGWINLGVANDDLWQRFCTAAERAGSHRAIPRYRQGLGPRAQPRGAGAAGQGLIKERTRDEWLARLDKAGVPSGAIRTVGEVCESDLLKARDMVAEMDHASAGTVKAIKNAVHLSATPLDCYAAPPQLGQHTREVLTGLLGYSASEFDALARDKVI